MKPIYLTIAFSITALIAPTLARQAEATTTLESDLARLPNLTKTHYSWPVPNDLPEGVIREFMRITNAYSIRGESHVGNQRAQLKLTLEKVNRIAKGMRHSNKNRIPSIAINYSVWHHKFPKDVAPFQNRVQHRAELELLRENFSFVSQTLKELERTQGYAVPVSAILFDSERFRSKSGLFGSSWNSAIAEKHTAAFELAKAIFPNARIEWYGRGCWRFNGLIKEWRRSRSLTLKEPGLSYSCPLYTPPIRAEMLESLVRTTIFASQNRVPQVTPWISLASGYKPEGDGRRKWVFDWKYNTSHSWWLGKTVNYDRTWKSPLHPEVKNSASIVILYPEPFGRAPDWATHFGAYVNGATKGHPK